MHSLASLRPSRILTLIILALSLSGCGQGDGQQRILGEPATELPPVPDGFCDVINFEILCPPPGILNFNGGQTSIIDNPDMSGLNTSDKVAQMQKFPDDPSLLFGGTRLDLAAPVDFSAGEAFTVKVWSPRSVRMIFKLEEANNPNGGSALELSHTGSGTWEELCYDFTGLTGSLPPIPAFTVIFDNGVAGAADTNPAFWTFYYDEIEQVDSCDDGGTGGGGGGGTFDGSLPVDFEAAATSYSFGTEGGFEGGASSVIANPQSSGINTSAQVGQMLKFNGAVFGGSTLAINPTNLAAGSSFTMKVWSQRAVPVQFQLEPYNDPFFTSVVMHNGAGWEELTFEFPTFSGEVSGITLIFDPTVAGNAETDAINWTFYFDDIALVAPTGGGGGGGGGGVGDIAINGGFESSDFSGWELFPGGGVQTITDVDPASGTYSANLTVPVRGAGDPAVDNIIKNANLAAGNLTAGASITVTFDMRGSLSGAGGVVFAELFSELSGGGTSKAEILSGGPLAPNATWTNYSYTTTLGDDVSGGVTLQLKASCGQVEGCGVDIFVDNVTIVTDGGGTGGGGTGGGGGTSGPVALPVDFEAAASSYDFGTDGGFEGGSASVIANPQSTGINTSAQVGQMQKFNGAVFGGSTLAVVPTTIAAGTSFTMKVWSQRAVPVLFQLEPVSNPFVTAEVSHTGSGWEELTFEFPTFADEIDGITLIFDNGTAGAAATDAVNWTFYFDDITLVSPSGGGGGGTAGNIAVNGDFETGDLSGWEALPGGGTQTVSTDNPASGTYSVNLIVPVRGDGDPPVDNLLKNANLEAGNLTPGDTVTVSFDMRGSLSGAGGVVFAEFFSESSSGGTSKSEILSGGPLAPNVGWTNYSFTTTLGPDVSAGVTLQLKASCGPVEGCGVDVFIDNVSIVTGSGGTGGGGGGTGGGGTGGGGAAGDIAVNGGFETGDLSGWEALPGEGTQVVSTDNPATGTYSVNLVVPVRGAGDPPVDNLLKNANLEAGNLTPGGSITVSFDMRGSLAGAGGVVFAEVFSELSGGGTSKSEILSGGPLAPNVGWTNYSFTTTLGPDVSGGVTLQLKASCGPVEGCGVDVFIDNVMIAVGDGGTGGGGTGGGGSGGGGISYEAISFDDAGTTFTLTGLNGAEGSFVTNDPAGGTNMVVQVDRSAAAQADAGTIVSTGANDSIPVLPLDAQNTQMTVRVYSPAADIPVRLKIENSTDSNVSVETETLTTVGGAWETLRFNFLNEVAGTTPFDPAATYDKVTIFFNFGTDGATAGAQTFYFDDIDVLAGTGGGGEGVELVINGDFETGDLTDWDATNIGGGFAIESPGFNSNSAVNIDVSGGPFNATLRQANLGAGQLTPGQEVTVSFDWKGAAAVGGIVRIGVISEPGGTGTAQTQSIIDTGAFPADWTTVGPLTFNLGSEVGGGVTFQVFLECGAESSCVADVSLDNISIIAALSGGGGSDAVLATFDEATPPTVEVFGGAVATIEAGPAGGDGSNALNIFRDGGQDFAGAYVIVPSISSAPGTQTVSADVYSPTAGVPMPARLIRTDGAVGTGDVQPNEAVVVGWQTLTWTFTSLDPAEEYPRFALLPNSGTIDTATSYYLDNITLIGGGGGGGGGGGPGPVGDAPGACGAAGELSTNCDFETGDLTGWTVFDNGGLVEVVATGGSTSLFAAHLVAGPTQNPLIQQFELAAGVVMPGDTLTILFDMKGTLSGDGGVVFAEFISEGESSNTNEFLTGGPIFPTSDWATYTFTPTAGADVSRGVSFQLVAVCGAVNGCGVDVYFDNVSVIIN